MQFYLVGEELRRALAQAGIAYEAYIDGFYKQGTHSPALGAAVSPLFVPSWPP